jgi:hypothetical protein
MNSPTIWKQTIPRMGPNVYGGFKVKFPPGSTLLSAGLQLGVITVWARVPGGLYQHEDLVDYPVAICGTGEPMPENADAWRLLGRIDDGPFIWHVFDATLPERGYHLTGQPATLRTQP